MIQLCFSSECKIEDSKKYDAYEEATIHFIDGTSVKGYAKIVDFLKIYKIKFKVYKKGKADTWDELMVKGLTLHREFEDIEFQYVAVMHKPRPSLLEVIEIAEISAFVEVNVVRVQVSFGENIVVPSFPSTSPETTYTLYIKREHDEKAINLASVINFKREALKFFENCTQIVDRINQRKYKRRDVLEMVYYYNDFCAKIETVEN